MKGINISILVICCCIQANSQPLTYCTEQYSCVDCTSGRVCAPTSDGKSLYELLEFTCSGDTPYCDPSTGSCCSVQPTGCPRTRVATDETPSNTATVAATDFVCMRNGYFPDPRNCSAYYNCHNDSPLQFHCPMFTDSYVMYHQTCFNEGCLDSMYSSLCSGQHGVRIPYSSRGDQRYYAFCLHGAVAVVDRCIGMNMFNAASQQCEPSCQGVGLYPSAEDCTKYYRCSPRNASIYAALDARWDMVLTDGLTCPPGQGFSEREKQCIGKVFVPNCNVDYKGLFN